MQAFLEGVVDLAVAANFNLDVDNMGFFICDVTVREAISERAVGCIPRL